MISTLLGLFLALNSIAWGDIIANQELFITDVSVVNDARTESAGPWSFAAQLAQLAPSPDQADALVAHWLSTWATTTSNGYYVTPRPIQRLSKRWGRDATGVLKAKYAPFRLLAVSYRPDIQEGRLIYCAFDPVTRTELQFNIILEFQLPPTPGRWARDFHVLGSLPFGAEYNAKLAVLIERFATKKNLLRMLTNEVELGSTWEMREFQIGASGMLELVPLASNPHDDFAWSRSGELADWLKKNQEGFLKGTVELPESMEGGTGTVFRDTFVWLQGSGVPEETRRAFALKTCTGCHGAETGTLFTHVFPRNRKAPSNVSTLLQILLPERAKVMEGLLQIPEEVDALTPPPPPQPLYKRRAHELLPRNLKLPR